MQFSARDQSAVATIAETIASTLKVGDIVLLKGGLGAGKTYFARALIQHLIGADVTVPSPTFNLVQVYETETAPIHHYDLYRLDEEGVEDDIIEIGWDDSTESAITLVEWPDRLGNLEPQRYLEINFEAGGGNNLRDITVTGHPDNTKWQESFDVLQQETGS